METTVTFGINDFQYCDFVNNRREYFCKTITKDFFGRLLYRNGDDIEIIPYDYIQLISKHITLTGYQCTFEIKDIAIRPISSSITTENNPTLKGFKIWFKLGKLISYTKKTDYTTS